VRHAHVGVHPQRDPGLNYVGVLVPVGRMQVESMRQIADIADEFGRGDIRLTVFQNLLIPHVRDEDVEAVKARVIEAGFQVDAGTINNGLVACTGNTGCKYAAANTKGHAVILGKYLQEKVPLEKPINIHLTGCPHSCAQHYVGDIGMQGAAVTVDGQTVEGYHIVLGGGMDHEQGIAREFYKGVPFDEIPPLLERVLKTYERRCSAGETFIEFTRRHEVDALKAMVEEVAV
jgi:ferredoxin-nitrite reductase